MTDSELEKAIQDIAESIGRLPKSDAPLPGKERQRRAMLLMKKQTLDRIKEAREKREKGEELYNIMVYGLLTSVGEKHPFLASLIKSNLRWGSF